MNWTDLAIVATLLVSTGYGLSRGGLYELFNLLAWLAAFFLAYYYMAPLANALQFYVQDDLIRATLSFACIFLVGYIVATLVVSLLYQMLRQGPLNPVDRIAGLLIGGARGWALVVIGLMLIELIGLYSIMPSGWIAGYFDPGIGWLTANLPVLLEWINQGPETTPELPAFQ